MVCGVRISYLFNDNNYYLCNNEITSQFVRIDALCLCSFGFCGSESSYTINVHKKTWYYVSCVGTRIKMSIISFASLRAPHIHISCSHLCCSLPDSNTHSFRWIVSMNVSIYHWLPLCEYISKRIVVGAAVDRLLFPVGLGFWMKLHLETFIAFLRCIAWSPHSQKCAS